MIRAYKKGKRGKWTTKQQTIKLPVIVKQGFINNHDMLDFMIKYKGFSLIGEYTNASVNGKNLYLDKIAD